MLSCAASLACSPERAPEAPSPIPVASVPPVATTEVTPDAGATDAASPCIRPSAMVERPYVVDLGRPADWRPAPNEGPSLPGPGDQGPAVRVTMTAFDAPEDVDGYQLAAYLPYYVAKAYQEAVQKGAKLAGDVEVHATLAIDGTPRDVRVRAPGFPPAFVYEVTMRASSRWNLCAPLAAPSPVRVAMTLTRR